MGLLAFVILIVTLPVVQEIREKRRRDAKERNYQAYKNNRTKIKIEE